MALPRMIVDQLMRAEGDERFEFGLDVTVCGLVSMARQGGGSPAAFE